MRGTGVDRAADRVARVNAFLASTGNRELLEREGLGHLFGGSISARMVLFDTQNKKTTVQNLQQLITEHLPGESVLTDGGLQLFSLSRAVTADGSLLTVSYEQQQLLMRLAGADIFGDDFVTDIFSSASSALTAGDAATMEQALGNIGSKIGKLTKRVQSSMSPREVSFGEKAISEMISSGKQYAYLFDEVESVLKIVGGGYEDLSDLDKIILSRVVDSAGGMHPLGQGVPGIDVLSSVTGERPPILPSAFAFQDPTYAADSAMGFLEDSLQIEHGSELSNQLREIIKDARQTQKDDPRSIVEIIQDKIPGLEADRAGMPDGPEKRIIDDLINIIKANTKGDTKLGKSIETIADGTYTLVANSYEELLAKKISELNEYAGSISGLASPEENQRLLELKSEIDVIKKAIKSGDRDPTRFGIPGLGEMKGKAAVRSFGDLVGMSREELLFLEKEKDRLDSASFDALTDLEKKQLEYIDRILLARAQFDKYIAIGSTSSLKRELAGEIAYLAQNITMSKKGTVAVDAMLLLNDPGFITDPVQIQRMQANVDAAVQASRRFAETGEIPREILDEIRRSASVDLEGLSTQARALALRNRSEAIEIANLLRANVDPRKIPALVNRVKTHNASRAFAMKDEIPSMIIPDAFRYEIETRTGLRKTLFGARNDVVTEVQVKVGDTNKKLKMLNFNTSGNQLIVDDSVASTYKAALGTFDLDDSGIPILQTYQDASGRTRIAATMMRDPKGAEEMLLMRPDLGHAETLSDMLRAGDSNIARQVRSATINDDVNNLVAKMTSLGIGETTARTTAELAVDLIRGGQDERLIQKRLIDFTGSIDSDEADYALETVVRLVQEGRFGERFASDSVALRSLDSRVIDALTRSGSASVRGRDVIDPITNRTVGLSRNLGVEQGAPYSYSNFVELQRQGDVVSLDSVRSIKTKLNQELRAQGAIRDLTDAEIGQVFSVDPDGVGERLRSSIGLNMARVRAAGTKTIFDYNAELYGARLDDLENNIGTTINRMASANYLAPQLEDFESTLSGIARGTDLSTAVSSALDSTRFGTGMVAPSDIVDVINQMSGSQRVVSLSDIAQQIADQKGITVDAARFNPEYLKTKAAYDALSKQVGGGITADTLHTASISPSAFAKAHLEQQTRLLATQRAVGMALGVAQEELPGFDPLMIEKGGRLNRDADIDMLRKAAVQEYKETARRLRESKVSGIDVSRIESEVSALERASVDDVRRILSLDRNGRLFKRYGSVSQALDLAFGSQTQIEAQTAVLDRSRLMVTRAVSDARYADDASSYLRTSKIKSLFEEINRLTLDEATKPARSIAKRKSILQKTLGMELSKGLRAIEEIHRGSGANVLDIVETFESEMQTLYGAGTSKYLGYVGDVGIEDSMLRLHDLSYRRRVLRTTSYDVRARSLVEGSYNEFRSVADPSLPNLLDISAEQARDLLAQNADDTATVRIADQHVLDYLRLVSEADPTTGVEQQLKSESSRLATETYAERSAIEEARRIADETDDAVTRMSRTTPFDPEETTRIIGEIEEGVSSRIDEVFDAARSPYRRISEMMRDHTSSLRQIVDSRGFKQFAVGTAALIAGSFIYQNRKKKDHTQDAVTGPPLMPGGNPYEEGYPDLNTANQEASFLNPTISGMQYRINTSGSVQDLNRLRGLFGDVIDGPIDATMYNGLPMAGQDPYPDLASRF